MKHNHATLFGLSVELLLRVNKVKPEHSFNQQLLCNCIGIEEGKWGNEMVKECEILIVRSGKSIN